MATHTSDGLTQMSNNIRPRPNVHNAWKKKHKLSNFVNIFFLPDFITFKLSLQKYLDYQE